MGATLSDFQQSPEPVAASEGVCAMKHLTGPAAAVALLIAAAVSHADEGAWTPLMVEQSGRASSRQLADANFGRPEDTVRMSGSNAIYRAKIRDMADAASGASARDPIHVSGPAGYDLYDFDAWAMVLSGPIIGPYRSRPFSLFGYGFDATALNRWTMRSESLRAVASSDIGSLAAWLHPAWRF
jgi:hypothetical protein